MQDSKQQMLSLKEHSGCSLVLCQEAVNYAKGNLQLAKAFLHILTDKKPGITKEDQIQRILSHIIA